MRMTIAVVSLLSLVPSPLSASMEGAAPAQARPAQPDAAPSYVRRFEDVEFRPLNPPMSPGAAAARLYGDPTAGPHAVLFKMGRGATPLHYHSSTYELVVIQGIMKHWGRGEREQDAQPLGPGSYWHIDGGKAHADSCLSDECIAFIHWDGKRDGHLLEPQK